MKQESQSKKILVVEDDKFLGNLLVNHLKKYGFETFIAVDAEIGLEEMRKVMPHLVLLDIILPGMDGYEFLKIVKGDNQLSPIPVVILSNLGLKDEVENGLNLGALDFLVKSQFDLDEITEKIKKILNIA